MPRKPATSKPKKQAKPAGDKIDVSGVGQGGAVAAGRNARAIVINVLGGYWPLVVLLAIVILGGTGYAVWRLVFPARMAGDFRIAVAGFAVKGQTSQRGLGTELAQGVYLSLNQDLAELSHDFTVTIWSPDRVGTVQGETPEARAQSAQQLADKIGADVLVYGVIDVSQPLWEVTPEFYVTSTNFNEAQEITGQHQIGEPFTLAGEGGLLSRVDLSRKMDARAEAITRITLGLAYYSLRDYTDALTTFQTAENVSGWQDSQGKAVLYLLEGNAAAKQNDLVTSISYLNRSLEIDPEYARPIVSLASVYYLQALEPFNESQKPSDVDLALIDKAIAEYNLALQAHHQPALSDITTKVNFGLGQCYLMQVYAGSKGSLNLAVDKFKSVIADYRSNPRLRELAAESHARLGLIYALSNHDADAVQEYQQAAALLYDNPERQQVYKDRAAKLLAGVTPTP